MSSTATPNVVPGPDHGILPAARPGSLAGTRNPARDSDNTAQSTQSSPRALVNPAHWDGNSSELPAPFAPLDLPAPEEYFKRKIALITGTHLDSLSRFDC